MPSIKPAPASLRTIAIPALALVVLGAAASVAVAGPWTRPKGSTFAKFAASYLYTRDEFDADGEVVPVLTSNPLVREAAYREVVVSGYAEYGWRDRLTLVGSLPFKIETSARTEISVDASLVREVDVTNAGLGDLSAGARAALVRGRHPVAIEATVKLPLGYDSTPDNGGPALGTGHADLGVVLSAGLAGASAYALAWAGYRRRGGDIDDDAGFGVEAGGRAGRVFAQALVEGWYSTGDIGALDVSATTVATNQDVLKLIASAGVSTGATASLVAEVYHVLEARNAAAGTTVALSLVLDR